MQDFRAAVSQRIITALDESAPFIDDERALSIWKEFLRPVYSLAEAGKRTRALLVAAGCEAYAPTLSPIHAGTAVELYQLSALAHDDIIDESDTRRGVPAIHRSFSTSHRAMSMMGDSGSFGRKSAILAGDFLLSLAALEFERAEHMSADAFATARKLFHEMTAETAYGQYLDFRAELTALNDDQASAVSEALLVVRHKSARYSVELPLLIGAALAGATDTDLTHLSRVGRPLGIAFQLRDDELGIFGKLEDTGKPAGGDITEGKRTVLLALTRGMADADAVVNIDSLLGKELSPTDVAYVQRVVTECGAYDAHEEMITRYEQEALVALTHIPSSPILHSVMEALATRRS
ncbi:polyprenyl synthetase family protein [Trueperella bialowiezensis]|uniref:Octaprenyl-diphosphate synthase n=1 Tax=Trueperella bialowiezensis TaxID=312285 RepID=A0A3S4VS40_9ACTO|nr:polyprenyl synthetase family protein [Trueperella bialowiezensis]VEI12523.1 Octaprenyl-diphosphate synthase [Trueperella bialowiezensis]